MSEPIINSRLDLDLYKITQALHAHTYFPNTEVCYEFVNRSPVSTAGIIDLEQLREELAHVMTLTLSEDEQQFLLAQPFFKGHPEFIKFLANPGLSMPEVYQTKSDRYEDTLRIKVEGKWFPNILWETIILSIVNQMYFRQYNMLSAHREGHVRIGEKVEFFNQHPELKGKIIEFGTRRRFSNFWQALTLERFLEELPGYFAGTSNVKLAMEYGIKPIGTMAHELMMFYDAYYANAESQDKALTDWYNLFGHDLSIGLTDTFGSDFYFGTLSGAARNYKGHRHDSASPHEWTEKFITGCRRAGINPAEKIAVYSDGLIPSKMVEINNAWGKKVITSFGWGTNATNDLGFSALSLVMKMTYVKVGDIWLPTVKLSDNMAKAIGPQEAIAERKARYGHNHNNSEVCVY